MKNNIINFQTPTNSIFKGISFILLLLSLSLVTTSCEKDTLETDEEPDITTPCEEELILDSSDQQLIFNARTTNNAALADHDAAEVAAIYKDDFFILTSTNGLFTGKEEVQGIYQSVFDGRTNVLFVRTPTKITVNTDWNMASEIGQWIGTWEVEEEMIEVGGDYYAKWHKIDGNWLLRSEVYTQFDCSGEVVCSNEPPL